MAGSTAANSYYFDDSLKIDEVIDITHEILITLIKKKNDESLDQSSPMQYFMKGIDIKYDGSDPGQYPKLDAVKFEFKPTTSTIKPSLQLPHSMFVDAPEKWLSYFPFGYIGVPIKVFFTTPSFLYVSKDPLNIIDYSFMQTIFSDENRKNAIPDPLSNYENDTSQYLYAPSLRLLHPPTMLTIGFTSGIVIQYDLDEHRIVNIHYPYISRVDRNKVVTPSEELLKDNPKKNYGIKDQKGEYNIIPVFRAVFEGKYSRMTCMHCSSSATFQGSTTIPSEVTEKLLTRGGRAAVMDQTQVPRPKKAFSHFLPSLPSYFIQPHHYTLCGYADGGISILDDELRLVKKILTAHDCPITSV
jgi:hypothetical protein